MWYRFFDARTSTRHGVRGVTADRQRSRRRGLWRWMATVADRGCAASFSAGKLVGYLEALEATDSRLARAVSGELQDTIESVEEVRRRFERGSDQA